MKSDNLSHTYINNNINIFQLQILLINMFRISASNAKSFRGRKRNKKIDKEYSFSGKLHRLRKKEQIEPLFDSPNDVNKEPHGPSTRYSGKINNIQVRIVFNKKYPCYLYVKKEEYLEIAHNKARERLLKVSLEGGLDF